MSVDVSENIPQVDIVGSTIMTISASVFSKHDNTGDSAYVFFIHLSSGNILELFPWRISRRAKILRDQCLIVVRFMEVEHDIVGETIVAVAFRSNTDCQSDERFSRQVALFISSNRAAMNLNLMGGGSILHVENIDEVKRHVGREWNDLWAMNSVDVAS